MKITEQETECLVRILLGKVGEQEAEINRLDEDIDQQRKLVLDYYAMLDDAKNKVADLEKQLKEVQDKYNKALADIEDLTASAADEPIDNPEILAVWFNEELQNARIYRPHNGRVCLCLTTPTGCIATPEDFVVLRYNEDGECWTNPKDDKEVFKYDDYIVSWWVYIDNFFKGYK